MLKILQNSIYIIWCRDLCRREKIA